MNVVRDWRLNGPRKEFVGIDCVVCHSKSLDPNVPVCRGCGIIFKPESTIINIKRDRVTAYHGMIGRNGLVIIESDLRGNIRSVDISSLEIGKSEVVVRREELEKQTRVNS